MSARRYSYLVTLAWVHESGAVLGTTVTGAWDVHVPGNTRTELTRRIIAKATEDAEDAGKIPRDAYTWVTLFQLEKDWLD